MGEVGSKQRDQIGQLLKDLANTIFYISSANIWWILENGAFKVKTAVATICPTLEKIGLLLYPNIWSHWIEQNKS